MSGRHQVSGHRIDASRSLGAAHEGAGVAIVARSAGGLGELASELHQFGIRTAVFPLDVTDDEGVDRVIRSTVEILGGIDILVNNAATSVYGEFDRVPLDEMRRVMDVNFFGQVRFARAALPYLEASPGGGRLIPVLSVESEISLPLHAIYTASKHALLGFYEAMHEELRVRRSKAKIAAILPASIDTPLFEHAKTYMGVQPKPIPPVYPPERVASTILERALHPRFKTYVGGAAKAVVAYYRLLPWLFYRTEGFSGYPMQKLKRIRKGEGELSNLYSPVPGTSRVHGNVEANPKVNWLETSGGPASLALGVGLGVGVAALLATQARRRAA